MSKINKLIGIFVIIIVLTTVQVNSLIDNNPSNNIKNITINVVETKKLNLTFIPIDNPDNFDSNMLEFIKFFNLTYPTSDDGLLTSEGQPYTSSPDEKNNLNSLLFKIAKIGILGNIQRTVGVVPKYWFRNFTNQGANTIGISYSPIHGTHYPSGLAEAREIRQVAAHEIGHTFGLCDEHNASAWDSQDIPLFRCPNGDIDGNNILDSNCEPQGCPTSTIGKLVPWNNSNNTISLNNLMGSGDQDKTWISNESYVQLLSKFQQSSITVKTALLVSGLINKSSGTISLFISYVIENAEITQQETNTSGNYSVEVIDNNNVVASKINFTPSFLDIGFNGSTVETNISYFIVVMNFTNDHKGVKVRENGVIKNETNRSINTPSLNITFPISGELVSNKMNVTYNASDLDGDTINYAILISSDNGNTFSTLEIDYTNKTLFVNTSFLSDSKQYKVKVLATDGINTNTTISQNTFEIDNDLRITNLSTLHENKTRKIFFYRNKNTLENNLSNIKEQLNTGDSIIQFNTNHSLSPNEEVMVFIEYNYTIHGDKTITATSTSGSLVETESAIINVPDIEVISLVILDSNLTKRIFRFDIKNNLDTNLTNINWTFDTKNSNVINNTITSILQPSEQIFIYIDYNFTSAGTYNVNATARNGSLSDSRNLTVSIT